MPRHALCFPCLGPLLQLAVLTVVFRKLRLDLQEVPTNAMLAILGYLLPQPDPSADKRLRAVFTEFDRDMAAILGDRSRRR